VFDKDELLLFKLSRDLVLATLSSKTILASNLPALASVYFDLAISILYEEPSMGYAYLMLAVEADLFYYKVAVTGWIYFEIGALIRATILTFDVLKL